MALTKLVIDAAVGTELIVELTADEITEHNAAEAAAVKKQKDSESNEMAKAAARQAVLDRLGLTEEEAQLIIGGSN